MYRLLPLLGDVGLGILAIVFVSLFYQVNEMNMFWLLPLALAPDLDALPEVARRGKVAASAENPHDHRELLHKPVIWIGVLGLLTWFYGGPHWATATTIVTLHFIHDSVLTGWDVPWLSPFSTIRIKFFVNERNENSLACKDWVRTWGEEGLRQAVVAHGNDNWIKDLYLRPTVVSVVEYGVFALSLVALTWHLLA